MADLYHKVRLMRLTELSFKNVHYAYVLLIISQDIDLRLPTISDLLLWIYCTRTRKTRELICAKLKT